MRDYTKAELIDLQPIRGVYFLLNKSQVVYVGQSEHIPVRIYTHRKRIVFDEARFLRIPESESLDDHEKRWISALKPIYNRAVTPSTDSQRMTLVVQLTPQSDRRFLGCVMNGRNLGSLSATRIAEQVRKYIYRFRP